MSCANKTEQEYQSHETCDKWQEKDFDAEKAELEKNIYYLIKIRPNN